MNRLALFAVGAVGAFLLLKVYEVVKAGATNTASSVLDAINPLNQENIFYSGVNAVGANITGNKDFSLGVLIYEATHADEMKDLNKPVLPKYTNTLPTPTNPYDYGAML